MSHGTRFPPVRIVRIGGWTAMATAWAAAIIGRFSGSGGVVSPSTVPEPVTPAAVEQVSAAPAALPTMPEGGLLVLHLGGASGIAPVDTPAAAAPAPVAASAPQAIAPPEPIPAPLPVTSSGS